MSNIISKYLIADQQIRVYLLDGRQIQADVAQLALSHVGQYYLKKALNITALATALGGGKERQSFKFVSQNRQNKISTHSFLNQTITGMISLGEPAPSFKGGTLQTISQDNQQFGSAHTSYASLESGEFYRDMEQYYLTSEQTPTYLFPLSSADCPENLVLLLQPLPFAQHSLVKHVLSQINQARGAWQGLTLAELERALSSLLQGWTFLDRVSLDYHCSCSKEMFIGLIFALSGAEQELIKQDKSDLSVTCSLCGRSYTFTHAELLSYLEGPS